MNELTQFDNFLGEDGAEDLGVKSFEAATDLASIF
jgi:hypothetical protein